MIEGWGLAAAGVAAAGAIGGAAISANASKNAASAAANSQQQGVNAQMSMFNTTQANYAPQIQLGQGAANMLGGIYGIGGVTGGTGGTTTGSPQPNYAAFYNSPGYQFALSQGQAQVNKQAAAGGNLYSSNTLAALGANQQGIASQQYNNYINQLTTMAGLGNSASSGVGSAATATGQGVANSLGNAGNAIGNGILGQSNAFTNALGAAGSQFGNLMANGNGFGGGSTSTAIGNGLQNDIYDNSGNYIPPPTFDPVGGPP